MRTAIVYVHPIGWDEKAIRFLASYHANEPGGKHESVVICNGYEPNDGARILFGSLPNLTLIGHNNVGQDIGAFQFAAAAYSCDMMIFFGAHSYFRKPGWLARCESVFAQYGEKHLYGATGNQGNGPVWPHVRTTGFWCAPELMNQFPWRITQNIERYEFEHGGSGLTTWVLNSGRRALVCGFVGEFDVRVCDHLPAGLHRADQGNVIFGDRFTCLPFGPDNI
jgi:hypothetical protein